MDSSPVGISITQEPIHSTAMGAVSSDPVRTVMRIVSYVFAGIGVGVIMSFLVLYLPYDRVVVMGQSEGSVVRVSSLHLAQNGFLLLYLRTDEGWRVVGDSGYLSSGYYRDITIPIDLQPILEKQGRMFVAEIYHDTGDRNLSIEDDIPVKDMFGRTYHKRFWFLYPENTFKQLWVNFLNHPLSFIVDAVIP